MIDLDEIFDSTMEDFDNETLESVVGANLANFYYFKPDHNKYYTEGVGNIPATNDIWTRKMLLAANGGSMPGLSGKGTGFRIVIVPFPTAPFGWPQIKEPEDG